ncbi:MAG: hypothetical protein NC302_07990 [Bacteroidales bacterium]|nr:hypothetical protein [Bacteroidales bacterium]MCM1416782.1 hypothetical protein [bacterium]
MSVAELTVKLESLSQEDYNMIVMLVERLAEKPSNILKKAREKYVNQNPMSMQEIDREIEAYRGERQK